MPDLFEQLVGDYLTKILPPWSSGEDVGDRPIEGADEGPFSSKVTPSQSSREDAGDRAAEGAAKGPSSKKVVPTQRSGQDAGDLPVFLARQLHAGTGPTAPTPSEEATDAPPSQQTEREEQPEDGRAA